MSMKDDFSAQLNSSFSVSGAEPTIELELIEVSDVVAEKLEHGQAEPFSAVFRHNGSEGVLEQATYGLNHQSLGELAVFLVPIGPDPEGMCYEAIYT